MPFRAALAALVGSATAVAGLVGPGTAAHAGPPPFDYGTSDITMIQANILSKLSVERFQADVRKVLAPEPDFITYNEVPVRQDWVIAPDPYDVHRDMRNRYTKATAVAWRADRWTEVDSGTFRISNYRKKPPGRSIKIGLRHANWVTLTSPDGRVVSVVAAHLAPKDRNMPSLLRSSVKRLGVLTEELAPRGPVLIGGDFNVHYRSSLYPRDLFEAAGLVPTYDTLGTWFPTGDHRGATIDYIFNRGEDLLGAAQHTKFELNSDHDAVVAGFDWLSDVPADIERVVSDPSGTRQEQRAALAALVGAIRTAEPGEELQVVTAGLAHRGVFRRLKGAVDRGVHLRFTSRSARPTRREQGLARVVRASGDSRSSVRRCREGCLRAWRDSGMARSLVLVRDGDRQPRARVDVSRTFTDALVRRRTRVTTYTGSVALDEGEEQLRSLR